MGASFDGWDLKAAVSVDDVSINRKSPGFEFIFNFAASRVI